MCQNPKYCSKINVCAGISIRGRTRLFIFSENLDAKFYSNILRYVILSDIRAMYGKHFRLAQGNGSKITVLETKNYLNLDMLICWMTGPHALHI